MNIFYFKKLTVAILRTILRIDSRIKNYYAKKKGIFDYIELSKSLKNYSFQIYNGNNTFGILRVLEKYCGKRVFKNMAIEHGFYLGDFCYDREIKYPNIVTMSKNRKEILKEKNKDLRVIEIGPYIHYAKSYYSEEEMKKLKAKYGKILLAFPTHSLDSLNIQGDSFIEKIEELKKDYDTIFVCLFYVDIQNGQYQKYLKKGYKIVTAGHRYDIKFLERLRSIIELSDYTISNSFGTHVIYCTHLNKVHSIFEESLVYKGNSDFSSKDIKKVLKEAMRSDEALIKQKEKIKKYYNFYPSKYSPTYLKKELDYLFGFTEVKTKKELYNIFDNKKDKMINE